MALFASVVKLARSSVHCALYDFSDALLPLFDSRRDIDVRIATYNVKALRSYITQIQHRALSHNKFCIIDGQTVWTGSFNPTGNANRNDVLLLRSRYLVENYEAEFAEFTGAKQQQTPHPTITGRLLLENAFCPDDDCDGLVMDALRTAEKSIYVMAYSFTYPVIGQLLLEKAKQGVDVKVILEARQIQDYSVYASLQDEVPVHISNQESLLHYKVFIIDDKIVITGSANPTRNGYHQNDENILILHHPSLASTYTARFMGEWSDDTLLRAKTDKHTART